MYMNLIEGVQHRATKFVPEIRNLTYGERIKKLKSITLEETRVTRDIIGKGIG